MHAFVLIQSDLERLNADILPYSKVPSVTCVGLYELSEIDSENLQLAEKIYFVISETSMCSSAYQALLLATFPLIEKEKCYLLRLDGTQIPLGFSLLRALPDGRPT